MHEQELTQVIDRMAEITNSIKALKNEYDVLEASILARFADDTENTKHKSVVYTSERGNISAAETDTVKVVYPSMLESIFGAAYPDMVRAEVQYKLNDAAKKLLSAVYKGEYMLIPDDRSFEDMVNTIPAKNDKTRKALLKKLKGKSYDKDKETLMKVGGFSETEAADYAYMLSETAAWCTFRNMLRLDGRTSDEDIRSVIDTINCAVTVETSPKVSLKLLSEE